MNPAAPVPPLPSLGPVRLLLVEDDPDSAEAMAIMLGRRGFEVTTEARGETAMARFHAESFDAVLSDVRLDGLSGVDLLKAVREHDRTFPFVLITGYDSLDSAREAIRFGADDYVLKPLEDVADVAGPLLKAVDRYRAHRQNALLVQAVAEREARLRDITENASDVLFRYDLRQRRFDFMNGAASRLLGYPTETFLNLSWEGLIALVHPGDRERLEEMRAEYAEPRPLQLAEAAPAIPGPLTLRLRPQNGRYRWLSVTLHPSAPQGPGPATALVGVARDITAEREHAEQEAILRERLERAERIESVGLLAGGVAHDLNNLLTPILSVAEIARLALESNPVDTADLQGIMNIVHEAALQAKEVIRNMLTLSRRGGFEAWPTDLNEVVTSFLASPLIQECRQRHPRVELSADVPDDLGTVMGSGPHLQELLTNLVINAFEAIPEAGTIRVRAALRTLDASYDGYETVPPGHYACLLVEDTGKGIERHHLPHIFEPFYTRKRMGRSSGSGLGLAVVHGVLRDHHGYIDVESVPQEGTRFTVFLPTVESPAASPLCPPELPRGQGESILVVDDQASQRETTSRLLHQLGYEVTTLGSGRDMVRYYQTHHRARGAVPPSFPFDLVLLDMIMEPDIDGLDAYREAVAVAPGQPCIIVSGFAETDRVKEAMHLGVRQFLQKPYTMAELAQAVRRGLARQNS